MQKISSHCGENQMMIVENEQVKCVECPKNCEKCY